MRIIPFRLTQYASRRMSRLDMQFISRDYLGPDGIFRPFNDIDQPQIAGLLFRPLTLPRYARLPPIGRVNW